MKNWKKWAAGICALSLCMTAVSLPAAAEGEDDIALISDTSEEMPAADGTADADTADDTAEEATRSESLEEIAITAEQVTQYMQKKNSCDGITFYYRPEDYEDTISDEDVADLLDDIELAGIDDATGEVVCTLEEDSDNSDFVVFLSPESRWLVYMDPEYSKVTMVRQIVSSLDNELLFRSRDNRTLELYNKDYDEVERSYTTDGAAKDGKVT